MAILPFGRWRGRKAYLARLNEIVEKANLVDSHAAALETVAGLSAGAAVPDSVAATVADLRDDFNGLLTSLRDAGLIKPNEEEGA